jgi:DNA polymerase-3 subunit gamma/tau
MADHDDLNTDSAPPWEEEPAERDENTADIFGAPPAGLKPPPVPAVARRRPSPSKRRPTPTPPTPCWRANTGRAPSRT